VDLVLLDKRTGLVEIVFTQSELSFVPANHHGIFFVARAFFAVQLFLLLMLFLF
jgi:hypothetical protein